MSRTAIVSAYAFTAADGTNVAALNSGNDWWEQNASNGQLRVKTNAFQNAFANMADCCTKATGFTTDQYFKVQLNGTTGGNGDKCGGSLLNNGDLTHGFNAFSAYRIYYDDTAGVQGVTCEKIVNGTITALGTKIIGAFTAADFLECEATTSGGVVTFTVYKNGASIGTRTDSTSILTTGKPGICGLIAGTTILGDNWEAGNVTAATGTLLRPRAMTGGMHDMSRGL
jgi:hypothetical protein